MFVARYAYPDPDDTDPTTRDGTNLGEAPVTVGSNDRRDKLSDTEGTEESERRTLHEEESVRTGDEDQSLGDDGDLEVDNHVQLLIVVVDGLTRCVSESNTELVLEESGVEDDSNEGNTRGFG